MSGDIVDYKKTEGNF
jgi:hypothetical protein